MALAENVDALAARIAAEFVTLRTSAGAKLFVQNADPETTHASYTGPAVWFQTDVGGTTIIARKVRP